MCQNPINKIYVFADVTHYTVYTSIGVGALAIILLGLIIGILVKKRKDKNLAAVERNVAYGLADYYEDTELADRNDYYKETSRASSSGL